MIALLASHGYRGLVYDVSAISYPFYHPKNKKGTLKNPKEYPMNYNYADKIADYLRERNKASRRPKPKKQEPEKKDA